MIRSEKDVRHYIFRFWPHVPGDKFDVIARYDRIWLLVVTPKCELKKYLVLTTSWKKLNEPKTFDKFVEHVDLAFIDAGYE
jgi:hypothetical protein